MRIATVHSIAFLCLLSVTLTGCGQQFGALLYHSGLIPEEKVKTQFKLTENRLAILIDDPAGVLPYSDLRNDIHRAIADDLLANKVTATIISPTELARVERDNRDYDTMSIRAIGEQAQADQVLHVQIQSFSVGDQAKMSVFQGQAKALVKVCSTLKRPDVRLWPLSGDGQAIEVAQLSEQTDQWNPGDRASEAYSRMIATRLGKRIAMVFYEHTAQDEQDLAAGRNPQPR